MRLWALSLGVIYAVLFVIYFYHVVIKRTEISNVNVSPAINRAIDWVIVFVIGATSLELFRGALWLL